MNIYARNALALICGLVFGSAVNMGLVTVGHAVIASGVDMSDMDSLKENMKLLGPAHFLFPFLAHALGTLAGAASAAHFAASHPMRCALVIGLLFLAGGVSMVVVIGGPLWFIFADLLFAYIPMGILGGQLARRKLSSVATK